MFSSDLSVDERWSRLGHMASVPTLACLSGADEYVPCGNKEAAPPANTTPRMDSETKTITAEGSLLGKEEARTKSDNGDTEGAGGWDPRSPEALSANLRRVLIQESADSSPEIGIAGGKGAERTVSKVCVLEGADHGLGNEAHALEFVAEVEAFVSRLGLGI